MSFNLSKSTHSESDTMLTRKEAAEYLGVQPSTLAAWACNKRYPLPYVKVGRAARYRLSDLQDFINANLQLVGE